MQGEELSFEVLGLKVAGLGWGPSDGRPVLALHGWLDNAASFATLGPLLTGCRVVALDMPGHGLSDPRGRDASYNLWDDLPQIEGVLDALGWDRVVMVGHSRGAMQALLTCAALPDRTEALVTLDGLVPRPTDPDRVGTQLGRFLGDLRKYADREDRIFPDVEAFVERRRAFGIQDTFARGLATRALEQLGSGWRLRGDPRLMGASAVKFDASQIDGLLRSVAAPALCLWAEKGLRTREGWQDDPSDLPEAKMVDAVTETLAGDHHFHMDPSHAQTIATRVLRFLS